MVDQAKIHLKTLSNKSKEREEAVEQFRRYFAILPSKKQAWDDLFRLSHDWKCLVRYKALIALGNVFPYVFDKEQAWDDLHQLIQNADRDLLVGAVIALEYSFSYVPNKKQAWDDLYLLTRDAYSNVRRSAAVALGRVFPYISNKKLAWNVLIQLTQDGYSGVRRVAMGALGSAFSYTPDKKQAWEDLHSLTQSNDIYTKRGVASALSTAFPSIPDKDKEQALSDLHVLARDWDSEVQRMAQNALFTVSPHILIKKQTKILSNKEAAYQLSDYFRIFQSKEQTSDDLHRFAQHIDNFFRQRAADVLGTAFPHIPNKTQAWEDLHRLTQDENSNVRSSATIALGSVFPYITDKEQVWEDLHRLTQDKNSNVRSSAIIALGSVFPYITDKEQVWEDLHRLTMDKDFTVLTEAVETLGQFFHYIPNKKQAMEDLHRLTMNKAFTVKRETVDALCNLFPYIPNKKQAWDDMIRLALDKNDNTRWYAINALSDIFLYITDKQQAWDDMVRLVHDRRIDVQWHAVGTLGKAFPYVPDKKHAYDDLISLTVEEGRYVRQRIADVFGTVFLNVSNKEGAIEVLILLTQDTDSYTRATANHSLGRAYVFMATEAESEDEFRNGLEKALEFFECSTKESTISNPSKFCLPFYRSFYTLTFRKQEAKDEVKKYLTEAKSAVKGSESKEKLLEAVENLANALTETQKAMEMNLEGKKCELNAYRRYCDRATELLETTEEKAPGATRLIRRGLPIIDEVIKGIVAEIQKKTAVLCKQMKDTPLEDLGHETVQFAKKLATSDITKLYKALDEIGNKLIKFCGYLPEDKRKPICEEIGYARNLDILAQAETIDKGFDYMIRHLPMPPITTIHIEDRQKDIIKIAVIQFCYQLTKSFPPVIENKDAVKAKIFSGLDIAKKEIVNIVCLPELCLCEEWIPEIEKNYHDMIVIGGGFYKDNKNICPVITKSDIKIFPQSKITPSASEDPEMWENGMISGDMIYKYETRFGKFLILICRDFERFAHYFREDDIDFIFCPAFNEANDRFHVEANNHVTKTPSYILIANTGVYGGSSIFGQLNKNYFIRLIGQGCKTDGDMSFKLCEVKKGKDEIIIADFNIKYKSIQIPTPSESSKEKRSVTRIKKLQIT